MMHHSFKYKLFGSVAKVVIFDMDFFFAKEVAQKAYEEALRLHKIFDNFVNTSEISKLNKKRKLKVSDEFIIVLKEAIKLAKITNGEYDISLGKQFMMRKLAKEEPVLKCSYNDIKINKNIVYLNHIDVQIDLGSIAKGYIAQRMIEILKSEGVESGYVDARGDIIVFGNFEQKIGILHPRDKNEILGYVKGENLCIATSGDYNQYVDSFEKSHIINSKDLISVSVIAPSLMLADSIATSIFTSSKKTRKKILDNYKNIEFLYVDKSLNVKMSSGFKVIFEEVE